MNFSNFGFCEIIEYMCLGFCLIAFLFSFYAPLYLVYAFIKRVICRKKFQFNWVLTGLSMLCALVLYFGLLPRYEQGQIWNKFDHCTKNCKSIWMAIEQYSKDHNGQYPSSLSELVPIYMKKIPRCPGGEWITILDERVQYFVQNRKDTYSPSYRVYNDPAGKRSRFTFCCSGKNHWPLMPADTPCYNLEYGVIGK